MSGCLLESSSARKNKISLTDYNYQKDIENRLLLAKLNLEDARVLEEILYSSLHIRISDLAKSLDMEVPALTLILNKLAPTGLFSVENQTLSVDKDSRKYFEVQIRKLEEDFQPNMEFLQSLLKKIPIHVLPIWYSIPRTSNNIFESLIEKHLLTPQIFQRYIMEINLGEPALKKIIEDVYEAENFEVPVLKLMEKYNINRELFEEYMLHLEFSFICCVTYRKTESGFEEMISPFHEWREYAGFLQKTEPKPIEKQDSVTPLRPGDFCFAEDATVLLKELEKRSIPVVTSGGLTLPEPKALAELLPKFSGLNSDFEIYGPYIHRLIAKLALVKLIDLSQGKIGSAPPAKEWLSLGIERKALYFYRHPLNKILSFKISSEVATERAMREAEKSISRVLDKGWVLFEDFLEGCLAPLKEEDAVSLKKVGKNWKYVLPSYSAEEQEFLYAIIFEWLTEAAIVKPGSFSGKACFCVTPLGQTLFGR